MFFSLLFSLLFSLSFSFLLGNSSLLRSQPILRTRSQTKATFFVRALDATLHSKDASGSRGGSFLSAEISYVSICLKEKCIQLFAPFKARAVPVGEEWYLFLLVSLGHTHRTDVTVVDKIPQRLPIECPGDLRGAVEESDLQLRTEKRCVRPYLAVTTWSAIARIRLHRLWIEVWINLLVWRSNCQIKSKFRHWERFHSPNYIVTCLNNNDELNFVEIWK